MKYLKTYKELNEKKDEEKHLDLGDLKHSVNLNKKYNWDAIPKSAKVDDRWYANANKYEISIGDEDPIQKFQQWNGKYWRYSGEEKLKYEPRSGVEKKINENNFLNFKNKSYICNHMKNNLTNNRFKIRNIKKMCWKNDGFRTLYESVIYPEVLEALNDWKMFNSDINNSVLIGGLAIAYYIKPRKTEDIDLIFMSYDDIPTEVFKFRKNRKHAFEHIKTGVEIELITHNHINQKIEIFEKIFNDSSIIDDIRVASPVSLIALKLGRFKGYDMADCSQLYEYCKDNNIDIDNEILKYDLTDKEIENFNFVKSTYTDTPPDNMYLLELKSYFRDKALFEIIKDEKLPYEIYIFEEEYGEPRFHYGKDILKERKKYTDFQFSVSLTEPLENDKLKVLESSTGYKSFNGFEEDGEKLKNWISEKENLNNLIKIWNKLNYRIIQEKK